MGLTTQDISVCALNNSYPALYREMQVRNWTHIDVVLTFNDGSQEILPSQNTAYRESDACIEIEQLKFNGVRVKDTKLGTSDPVPIPGTRYRVPFELFRNAPYRVAGLNIIISTVDHSYTAAQMVSESNYNPVLYETSVDEELTDPRLVFRVIDPANRWTELYVSVFGKTIILRSGHWANTCPLGNSSDNDTLDKGKLCCYLRYPYQYVNTTPATSTVFEVSLENVLNEEPVIVPGGDVLCVATSMEALGKVLAKKRSGQISTIPQVATLPNMISKSLYDDAQARFKEEVDRLTKAHAQEIANLKLENETKVLKLQADLAKKEQEATDLKSQVTYWKSYYDAGNTAGISRERLLQEQLKVIKLRDEAKAFETKVFWDNAKSVGSLVAALATTLITLTTLKKGR